VRLSVKETLRQHVSVAYSALDDKKGENIVVLDISKISVLSDYFIIATGRNKNHIRTLVDNVQDELEKSGKPVNHREGADAWVLLDYGDFIVHVFGPEDREFYNIEHIWGDADRVNL
jgi:ribosome-associated protein